MRINLLGVWYCCRAAGARMLGDGKGGSIINIASVAGMAGWKDHPPAYQSTKAAVINLTRNLACSWADRGVRVNAIAPGWFPSEMTDPFFAMGSMKAWAASTAPMGRVGNPDELAGPVLFLASDASSFVTGQTLVVDGGLSATSGYCPMPEEFYQQLEAAMPNGLGKRIKPDPIENQYSVTIFFVSRNTRQTSVPLSPTRERDYSRRDEHTTGVLSPISLNPVPERGLGSGFNK